MNGTIAAALTASLLLFANCVNAAATVQSPDGRIEVSVDLDAHGQPNYSVAYRGRAVVAPSRLGLRFNAHQALDSNLKITSVQTRVGDGQWEQPWGERRLVRDHYRELTVNLASTQGPDRKCSLVFRAYDDGIGFRYVVPKQPYYGDVAIVDELTTFNIDTDATAWWIPGRGWNRYEYLYHETKLSDIRLAHTPATFRLADGTHLSLHEAALVDYPGYVLDQRRPGELKTNLTPLSSGPRALKTTPFATPWRTIQIAPDAVGLLNSSLILNLNEPNKLGDVSWVEPGRYVGIWWAMHVGKKTWGSGPDHGATTADTERYMDFAAANGFAGVLVEGWNVGWDGDWYSNGAAFSFTKPYPDFDIKAITAYGASKGVRLIGHNETSGHISNYESQMAAAYDLYASLGIRQVKTGYVADGGGLQWVDDKGITHYEWHDSQLGVNHYLKSVTEAAKRKISIITHEPIKDTGLRRTYPNWISREGARGQEFNAWGEPPNPPSHTATLPYTRLLAGPMDFTPGIFDLTFKGPDAEQRVSTTLMKQLALYVVIYAPVQMAADLPENYAKYPDAFGFITSVPTDWEQSIALAGEVGEYVAYARQRRGGQDWYIGALTNEDGRTLSVPLSFLTPGMCYTATIYHDGENADWHDNPYNYAIDTRQVDSTTALQLRLAPGGGAAIRLMPSAD